MAAGSDNTKPNEALSKLRVRIDEVDAQLRELLGQRAAIALEVGEVKAIDGSPVYRPEREAQIFKALRETEAGPLKGPALEAIYREIISLMKCFAPHRPAPSILASRRSKTPRKGQSPAPWIYCATHHCVFPVRCWCRSTIA